MVLGKLKTRETLRSRPLRCEVGIQFFFLLLCAWRHRSFAAIPTKYYKIHPSG